jgi:hypothetical protein
LLTQLSFSCSSALIFQSRMLDNGFIKSVFVSITIFDRRLNSACCAIAGGQEPGKPLLSHMGGKNRKVLDCLIKFELS